MKFLKITFILVLIIQLAFLYSETITEIVYSDPALDGYIHFSQNTQSYSVNNWMYEILSGDTWGVFPIIPDNNSYFRGYISFNLPEIPENYFVDSVYVRLYQFLSTGYDESNGNTTDFPIWNVTGGDTVKCILSHIDYGNQLDIDDWGKGDVNNPYTYQNNVDTITEIGGDDYRYIDVTSSVIQDYDLNRDKNQYRIAFQIDTDWDDWDDMVGFISGNPPIDEFTPIIELRFTDEISSIENSEIIDSQNLISSISPNPIKDHFKILFSRKGININKIEIYNIKGQKLNKFDYSYCSNDNIAVTFRNISSGIYFLKVSSESEAAVKKFIVMK